MPGVKILLKGRCVEYFLVWRLTMAIRQFFFNVHNLLLYLFVRPSLYPQPMDLHRAAYTAL